MKLNQISSGDNSYKGVSEVQGNQSKDGVMQGKVKQSDGIKAPVGLEMRGSEVEQKNDPKRIQDAVDKANDQMKKAATRCEFSYHEVTNRVSIKVFDKDTDEIIREIPPEESLDMLEKIWEIAGLFVDETR